MHSKVIGSVSFALWLMIEGVSESPFGWVIYQNTSGGQLTYSVSLVGFATAAQADAAAMPLVDSYNRNAPQGTTYGYYVKDLGAH
jgi:hypothetical protein